MAAEFAGKCQKVSHVEQVDEVIQHINTHYQNGSVLFVVNRFEGCGIYCQASYWILHLDHSNHCVKTHSQTTPLFRYHVD